jgi:hypothetical protein
LVSGAEGDIDDVENTMRFLEKEQSFVILVTSYEG